MTVSDKMFYCCYDLVGGNNTKYASDKVDATFAHIDGGADDPGYLTAIDDGTYMAKGLLYTVQPEGGLSVSHLAKSQETVVIPSTMTVNGQEYDVTFIDEDAFMQNYALKEVSIPETIEAIGANAFYDCFHLEAIYCYATEPILLGSTSASARTRAGGANAEASTVFDGVNKKTCILYVPAGSVESYRAADGWREFTHIVEMLAGDANGDGKVDVADIVAIASHLKGNTPARFNEKLADTDHSGKITEDDLESVARIILKTQ